MFRSSWFAGLALLALLAGPVAARADVAIPPVARVTDLTGTLSAVQRSTLSERLADFEQEKGSQLAVLVLPTTQPETIEQYGIRVGDAWKLGRKGKDDGVILIVAKNDHRVRIEVGYGLEGDIPDATAKRIIDEAITPAFKAGDFYAGITAAWTGSSAPPRDPLRRHRRTGPRRTPPMTPPRRRPRASSWRSSGPNSTRRKSSSMRWSRIRARPSISSWVSSPP
jgi:uncharacterized membrane protein YgcG